MEPSPEHFRITLPPEDILFFAKKAEEKIEAEGWEGRDKELKKNNFLRCWITEEAFKKILIEQQIWFRHRGLYVGDAAGAGVDFVVKMNNKETSLGLRSIDDISRFSYKTMAYPDDRFRLEKATIADFHIACHRKESIVTFLGIISKADLLSQLATSPRKPSRRNQEYFRTVALDIFSSVQEFLGKVDKR